MPLLTLIVILPLLAALLQLAIPRNYRVLHRLIPLVATFCVAAAALALFCRFDTAAAGYQFITVIPGLGAPTLGIQARLGVDGINVGLILMGAIVAFAATCAAWEIQEREKEFYILLLVMTAGILGAFASLDLFFLYFFHELALIPTFIMIGVWGRGESRNYATFKMTLYLSVGALVALIGLVALYLKVGADSFDLPTLTEVVRRKPIAVAAQHWIFPLLLFGFGILVSLWPFHTWAPLGYSAAPTPTAMLHAGVLKKFGLYALIRVAIPFLPDGAMAWMPTLAALCLGNILWSGLVALRQRDLNLLLGNSSVAHMGFVFLGLASLSLIGVTGAVVIMVAHGFLAALSFGLSGYLYQRTRTLDIGQLGGLARQTPFLGTALILALLAGCGLPGFANFVGEALVFFGTWNSALEQAVALTVVACWGGLIIGGVYMIRAIRNVLHGPLPERWNQLPDLNAWRRTPFILLLAALLVFGCAPRLLTDRIEPAVAESVAPSKEAPASPTVVGRPIDHPAGLAAASQRPAATLSSTDADAR